MVICPAAEHNLSKLPILIRLSIESSLAGLETLDNPLEKLEPLKSKGKVLYSLRTGEYRAILEIMNDKLVLLVVEIGPRKTIYRKYQS